MTTLYVDMANISQNQNTYNCSGFDTISITVINDIDIYATQMFKASILGSTVTLKFLNYIYKFTNISDTDNVYFNFWASNGEHRYSGNVKDLLKDFKDPDAPTPKSVKGTNSSDYLDASLYSVKKGITINAGKADDEVIGTQYGDKIYGGAGNDTLTAGLGNDKIYGGSGADVFQFSPGDGADIIYDATNADKIIISDVNAGNLRYAKNGKNLEIFYDDTLSDENKIVVKNHFAKKSYKRIDDIQAYYDKIKISDQTLIIKGSGKINGTAGADIIKGGNKADKIKAYAGDDTIIAGLGNDKIYGGSGADVFQFSSTDGVDIIYDATNEDTIQISDVGADSLFFARRGKNLEIFYDNTFASTNRIIVKNHFAKDATQRVETLETVSETIYLSNQEVVIIGSGKIYGTSAADTIRGGAKADIIKAYGGNDTIMGGNGNDKIYGGEGDDVINAGAGKNYIYYSLNDGNDTIASGAGSDTLVFGKGVSISAEYSGDDAIITYSGTKNKVAYSNTITISDYKNNASVKNIKVGKKTKTVDFYLNGGQTGGGGGSQGSKTYTSTENGDYWRDFNPAINDEYLTPEYTLTAGNHTFVFDLQNTHGENDFGGDGIRTPNLPQSSYVDTLQFKSHTMRGGEMTIEFQGNNFNSGIDIQVDRYVDNPYYSGQKQIEHNGSVVYNLSYGNNGYSSNYSKLNIIDSTNRTYNVRAYNGAQTVNNSKLTTNSVTLIIDQSRRTSTVVSNSAYNYTSTRGTHLNYTYNGGHDTIKTDLPVNSAYTDDTYTINSLNAKTDLCIYEAGGNDTLRFVNTNINDIRVLFDVKLGDSSTIMDNKCICYVYKDSVTLDNLKLAMGRIGRADITGGVYVYDGAFANTTNIDNIVTKDNSNINEGAWYNAVMQSVAGWLQSNGYSAVSDALEDCNDSAKLTQLINCYKNVQYSI